jgi:hypothetical protein
MTISASGMDLSRFLDVPGRPALRAVRRLAKPIKPAPQRKSSKHRRWLERGRLTFAYRVAAPRLPWRTVRETLGIAEQKLKDGHGEREGPDCH